MIVQSETLRTQIKNLDPKLKPLYDYFGELQKKLGIERFNQDYWSRKVAPHLDNAFFAIVSPYGVDANNKSGEKNYAALEHMFENRKWYEWADAWSKHVSGLINLEHIFKEYIVDEIEERLDKILKELLGAETYIDTAWLTGYGNVRRDDRAYMRKVFLEHMLGGKRERQYFLEHGRVSTDTLCGILDESLYDVCRKALCGDVDHWDVTVGNDFLELINSKPNDGGDLYVTIGEDFIQREWLLNKLERRGGF